MNNFTIDNYGMTDIGNYRQVNEDYFSTIDYLFILADGMGGHNAGDIASKLAVEYVKTYITDNIKSLANKKNDTKLIQQIIHGALTSANEAVFQESTRYVEYQGMGTTLVIALFQKPNSIYIGNVGDSRAYLFRDRSLHLLSEDHTVTASMMRKGLINKKEAISHPFRHHLNQSIGTKQPITPFITKIEMQGNDKILLCSDGLWNVLSDEEIIKVLQKKISLKAYCKELIEKAKSNNSLDNITCIIIKGID